MKNKNLLEQSKIKSFDIKIFKKIKNKSQIPLIIFGAGNIGEITYYGLLQHGIDIDYFCDNDTKKHGTIFCGKTVISSEDLSKLNKLSKILIANYYIDDIQEDLYKMNFKHLYDCTLIFSKTDFSKMKKNWNYGNKTRHGYAEIGIAKLIEIYSQTINKKLLINKKLELKYIDVVITEKCSMKCKDCSNLMQYYQKPIDSELSTLMNSLDKIMNAVDKVHEFRVLGGEPFVNKNIHIIIDKLLTYKNADYITIYTNATIIPKRENLTCLRNKKIKLDITNYGDLSRNFSELLRVCKEEDILYTVNVADTWTDSGTINYQKKTDKQLKWMFSNCCVNDYITLLNGKLYRCPFSANATNINAIPYVESEVININSVEKSTLDLRNEITTLYYNKEYLSACSYCNGRDFTTKTVKAALQTKKPLEYEFYE